MTTLNHTHLMLLDDDDQPTFSFHVSDNGDLFIRMESGDTTRTFSGPRERLDVLAHNFTAMIDKAARYLAGEIGCESGPVFPDLDSDVGGPCVVDLGTVD